MKLKITLTILLLIGLSGFANAQAPTRYCMTVTDELGAIIPKASVRFSPTKQSQSRIKHEFTTDAEGAIDVTVVDGVYDISVKASSYKKVVLKNQLLPYDPRGCRTVKLKSTVPPHQIT